MNTRGFYKYQEEVLYYAPNAVYNANFNLFIQDFESYTYPVDGWYFFEDESLAREFYGLPAEDPE